MEDLDKGLDAIERLLKRAKSEGMSVFGEGYKKASVDLERGEGGVDGAGKGRETPNLQGKLQAPLPVRASLEVPPVPPIPSVDVTGPPKVGEAQ